jgi:hypothetical protein
MRQVPLAVFAPVRPLLAKRTGDEAHPGAGSTGRVLVQGVVNPVLVMICNIFAKKSA